MKKEFVCQLHRIGTCVYGLQILYILFVRHVHVRVYVMPPTTQKILVQFNHQVVKLIYLFHYYQVDCRLTSRSVAMSNMRILGGQTRRKSSMLVTTPASKTHNLLQRSARTRYTEMRPVQLMSPRPAVCHDQSGYACRYRNIYCDQNYFQKKT